MILGPAANGILQTSGPIPKDIVEWQSGNQDIRTHIVTPHSSEGDEVVKSYYTVYTPNESLGYLIAQTLQTSVDHHFGGNTTVTASLSISGSAVEGIDYNIAPVSYERFTDNADNSFSEVTTDDYFILPNVFQNRGNTSLILNWHYNITANGLDSHGDPYREITDVLETDYFMIVEPQPTTVVPTFTSAAEYISEAVKQALDVFHFEEATPNPSDREVAKKAYQIVINWREEDAGHSTNIDLRDAEYWLRGFAGGASFNDINGPVSLDWTDWFNDEANALSPISTPIYNAVKLLHPYEILDPGRLPGTPPGGTEDNSDGWHRAVEGQTLAFAVSDFAAHGATHQQASADVGAPLQPLSTNGIGDSDLSVFDVVVHGGSVTYFDPTPASDYAFGVTGNTFTGVLIPTSVSTTPLRVTVDGHAAVTVIPGSLFNLTTITPGGVSGLMISGYTGSDAHPTFGFTFLSDAETLIVEAQGTADPTISLHWMASIDVGTHPAGYQISGIGDFNKDGTSDVLWFNPTTRDTDIWSLSNGHWAASSTIGLHPAGYQISGIGDFNNDGTSDVLWYNPTTHDTDIWTLINGHWAASSTIGLHPAGYDIAGIGDFNKDGTSDVLWYNPTTRDTDIWTVINGHWAASTTIGLHPAGYQIAGIGDFNHDGTSDVLWVNPTTNETDVWTLNNGHWAGSTTIGSHPAGYQVAGIGDFNRDGTDDVVWYNPSNNDVDVWLVQNGHWAGSAGLGAHPLGSTLAGVGDFDHSGVGDLMWRSSNDNHIDNWMLAYS